MAIGETMAGGDGIGTATVRTVGGVEGKIPDAVPEEAVSEEEDGDRDFMDEKMQEWILNRPGTEEGDESESSGSEGEEIYVRRLTEKYGARATTKPKKKMPSIRITKASSVGDLGVLENKMRKD